MIFYFIYTIIDNKGNTKNELTAFQAKSTPDSEVLVQSFVRLRLGMLYAPNKIQIEWGVSNNIFASVKRGERITDGVIPILSGKIYTEEQYNAELEKIKSEQPTDKEQLQTLENVPEV